MTDRTPREVIAEADEGNGCYVGDSAAHFIIAALAAAGYKIVKDGPLVREAEQTAAAIRAREEKG